MTAFTDISTEFEFSSGVWTDVYQDVVGISVRKGIRGNGPMDRVASTGVLQLTLINHGNEYTPGHASCTSGFEKNVPFRITFTYGGTTRTKFYGRSVKFDVRKGTGLDYYTDVWIYDYMNQLMQHELQRPQFAENKPIEEVIGLILIDIPVFPVNAEVYTGESTFTNVFDTVGPATKAVQEISKVVNSEFGYVYVRNKYNGDADFPVKIDVTGAGTAAINDTYYYFQRYNSRPTYFNDTATYVIVWSGSAWVITDASLNNYYNSTDDVASPDLCTTWNVGAAGDADAPDVDENTDGDEVIVVEGRETRDSLSSVATFDDTDIITAETEYGLFYYNDIKTVVYPRDVDAAATSVLFTLEHTVEIAASATVTVTGRFRDPNQEAKSVCGVEMVAPVATTDYLFNTAADGSGSNITADLTVTASYGTNGVEYTLTNNNAGTGYVTFLQARGKGVYIYRPVEYHAEYADGISADGRRTLNLSMPYQVDPVLGIAVGDIVLELTKTPTLEVKSITFEANKNATLIGYFRDLDVGERITLDFEDLSIEKDYYINGIDFDVSENGVVICRYILYPRIEIGAL